MCPVLYVECQTEAVITLTLGISRKDIAHVAGKSRVIKRLEENKGNMGLVDQDPGSPQPRALSRYKEISNILGLKILIYPRRGNQLIAFSPRFEEWILVAAKKSGIDPKDFGLPDDPDRFHDEATLKTYHLRRLIEKLRRSSSMMKRLQRLLKGQNWVGPTTLGFRL